MPPVEANSEDPLQVTVEEFSEWIVDETQFKVIFRISQVAECTDNLWHLLNEKLFTLNTGHAVTAYLGKLAGLQFVKQSIDDEISNNKLKL